MATRMKIITMVSSFFIMLMLCSNIAAGKIIYVDDDATGLNDGSSWENAYIYLQEALFDAKDSEKPIEIYVAQGIYTPAEGFVTIPEFDLRTLSFQLINDVNIIGGFAGVSTTNPDDRDLELYETILSGDLYGDDAEDTNYPYENNYLNKEENSYHVVSSIGTNNTAVLDGFIIKNGNADGLNNDSKYGAGLYNKEGSPTIKYCTFSDNIADYEGGGLYSDLGELYISDCNFSKNKAKYEGGGLSHSNSNITLKNCSFSMNIASLHGGGLHIYDSNATVNNCTFINNTCSNGGGGGLAARNILNTIRGKTLQINNCRFINNISYKDGYGGGLYSSHKYTTISNSLFNNNSADEGGGCFIESKYLAIENCTSVRDIANNNDGNFLYCLASVNNIDIINSIVWYNENPFKMSGSTSNISNINYNNIQGGWSGEGNIDEYPKFVDPLGPDKIEGTEDDDLRIAPLSPCVDTGDPNYSTNPEATDLDGNLRIFSDNIDMGAYEFQGEVYVEGGAHYMNIIPDGSIKKPLYSIQSAIDIAKDNYKIFVFPETYDKINFLGKAITVAGIEGAPVIKPITSSREEWGSDAVTFYSGEDSNSVLKNFIITNSELAISLNYGSNPTIQGITFVDNTFGIAAYEDSNPDIRNCIFYNNTDGDLFGCNAWYSCFEGGTLDKYNIDADPLFVDAANGDYHLKSEGWRWNEQSESWTWDDVTSPCIDAGDPNTPLGDEPMSISRDPNNLYARNNRINMGAYSGTPQASMPPLGWIPINVDDFTSPSPNPAQWDPNGYPREVQIDPNYPEYYSVEMRAKTAADESEHVEYFFLCTSNSSFSSGWQTSPYYCVLVGRSGLGLRFRVTTRDEYGNQTFWSSEEQAITFYISNN